MTHGINMIENYSKLKSPLFIAAKLAEIVPGKLYASVIFILPFPMSSSQVSDTLLFVVFCFQVEITDLQRRKRDLMLRQVIHPITFP